MASHHSGLTMGTLCKEAVKKATVTQEVLQRTISQVEHLMGRTVIVLKECTPITWALWKSIKKKLTKITTNARHNFQILSGEMF